MSYFPPIKPPHTQMPNIIFDEWIKILSDVEFRIVCIVARQTFGWLEDKETGRRKEKDWISHSQLEHKTFRGYSSISKALKKLIDELGIVEAYNEEGEFLDSPQKRMACGTKIFYRLNTEKKQQASLFPTPLKFRRVKKTRGNSLPKRIQNNFFKQPIQSLDPQSLDPTKETVYTKLAKAGNPQKLPTTQLLGDFKKLCEGIRHSKPVFVRFKDGNLIKAALKHLNQGQLQILFAWFLQERSQMRATVGAALCKEVIDAFIKASEREQGFYLKWEGVRARILKNENVVNEEEMRKKLAALKAKFSMPTMPKYENN